MTASFSEDICEQIMEMLKKVTKMEVIVRLHKAQGQQDWKRCFSLKTTSKTDNSDKK